MFALYDATGGFIMSTEISRRTFIKGATAAGVALAAGTYFTWNGENIPQPVKHGEVTYDVLIIGSGGAGMRAALAAAENKNLRTCVQMIINLVFTPKFKFQFKR